MMCKFAISKVSYFALKYLSMRETAKKKVWQSHLKLVSTSIIQSIMRARRAGVILCLVKQFSVRFPVSRLRIYSMMELPYSVFTLMFYR